MLAMFILTISCLAALAVAVPTPGGTVAPARNTNVVSQCNTGDAQCCNSVEDASSPNVATILGLLGVALGSITGQVGLGCTPINLVGVSQGANCAQQPVCCQGNQFNGIINIGCTPISL